MLRRTHRLVSMAQIDNVAVHAVAFPLPVAGVFVLPVRGATSLGAAIYDFPRQGLRAGLFQEETSGRGGKHMRFAHAVKIFFPDVR